MFLVTHYFNPSSFSILKQHINQNRSLYLLTTNLWCVINDLLRGLDAAYPQVIVISRLYIYEMCASVHLQRAIDWDISNLNIHLVPPLSSTSSAASNSLLFCNKGSSDVVVITLYFYVVLLYIPE